MGESLTEPNFYQAPDAPLFAEPVAGEGGAVSRLMLSELHKTRPWVFMLSILGLIGTAFVALAIVVMVIAAAFVDSASEGEPPALVILLVGSLMAAIYGLPSFLLLRYGLALRRVGIDESLGSVELALARQRVFWRAMGVMVLAVFVIYAAVIVIAIAVGAMSSLKG